MRSVEYSHMRPWKSSETVIKHILLDTRSPWQIHLTSPGINSVTQHQYDPVVLKETDQMKEIRDARKQVIPIRN